MKFSRFETHVRSGMEDTLVDHVDTNATWSTREIASYLNDGLADYSQYFPRQLMTTITAVSGTQSYSLPLDIIQPPDSALHLVRWRRPGYEYDHMKRVEPKPGSVERIRTSGAGMAYSIWGNSLILADAPIARDVTYEIELWYHGLHAQCDPFDGEALQQFEMTVPEADTQLMFWYVTSIMMGKLEASDSDLRRWADNRDGGIYRDDNPARESAKWRMDKYEAGVALRLNKKPSPRLVRT